MIQTRAAVLRGPQAAFSIEEATLADPGPGEALVRIAGTGLCHTDLFPRSPNASVTFPLVVGHEAAGVVEALGPGPAAGIAPGDHVVVSFDSCGGCPSCLTGEPAYCETFFERNLTGRGVDGEVTMAGATGEPLANRWFGQSSLAARATVVARNLVPVERDLPLELLGPLGCGIQTGAGAILCALRVPAGASVAVFGAGAVGLSAVMAAQVAGATTIAAVEPHAGRRRLAGELGATQTFETGASLRGFDFALDTTGIPAVVSAAVESLGTRGVCGLIGIPTGDLVLDRRALVTGRTVVGILEGSVVPRVFVPRLVELWRQGRFPFDRLIETFPLSKINEAEAAAASGDVVKPVLVP